MKKVPPGKYLKVVFCIFLFNCAFPYTVMAHKVSIYAYAESKHVGNDVSRQGKVFQEYLGKEMR